MHIFIFRYKNASLRVYHDVNAPLWVCHNANAPWWVCHNVNAFYLRQMQFNQGNMQPLCPIMSLMNFEPLT